MTRVYRLRAASEGFQELALADESEWDRLNQAFDGRPLAESWEPPAITVLNEDAPAPDLTFLGAIVVFSTGAVEALDDVLRTHGEVLPLDERFHAYNVTALPDALDEDRSEVKYFRSSGRVQRILRYEFRPEALEGIEIFRLPQQPRSFTYVTDRFVARVEDAGLTGFDFAELWAE